MLQLSSGASPVGSYAWSDGLETAVASGEVHDVNSARSWIGGLLAHSLCALELPLLAAMIRHLDDGDAHAALAASQWLLACRETAELRASDRQQGQALMRVLRDLPLTAPLPAALSVAAPVAPVSYAFAFALAAQRLGIDARSACTGFAFAWIENMVTAAIKLVPLGHGAGQRLIFELGRSEAIANASMTRFDADTVATGAPGLAIASARHEIQPTRLFRS